MLEANLQKRLGAFTLDVELSCETSGIIALFGRSGAGKTTLINLLAGLVRPDTGQLRLNGETLFDSASGRHLPPERRRLGYVFQEGRLFPHMNVRDNLCYGYKRVPPGERKIVPDQVIALLGLEALLQRRPGDLSGGEKQRVALGRALLANPRLLLMDEPLVALDQPRKEEILPFVERLRDELAVPIVYVSHAMDELVRLADTLVLMSEGRIAAVGPIDQLTSRLDLRPLTGRHEAGAVIQVKLAGQDRSFGLSDLAFPGGRLRVPAVNLPIGSRLRIRIRARDVALALTKPSESSILNVLPGQVREISAEAGPLVDVLIDLRGTLLWARITTLSCQKLALAPGKQVYALIKAVAVDRHSLGRPAGTGRFLESDKTT